MYAKVKDGAVVKYPTTPEQEYPNTSFPDKPTAATLAEFGLVQVAAAEQPQFDPLLYQVAEGVPANSGGTWNQTWVVTQLSENEAANNIRMSRNSRLAECDWTQLPDAPVDRDAWATYRQALRDVTAQSGFPWNVIWPAQP